MNSISLPDPGPLLAAAILNAGLLAGLAVDSELRGGIRLGRFEVYPLRNEIVGAEGPVHVQPRVMDVLLRLAAEPGDVVERETLLDDVWEGVTVSDETLSRAISDLRASLMDHAAQPQFIQTVPNRGYRLVASVDQLQPSPPRPDPGRPVRPIHGSSERPLVRESASRPGAISPAAPRPALATAGVAQQPAARPADEPETDSPFTIWNELKRRNVFRVGAAYAAVAWLIIEVSTTVQDYVGVGDMAIRLIVTALAIGLPIALALAWAFEVTPDGILYDKPDLVQNESTRARKLRRLDAVTILTITIATSVFVYRSLTFEPDDAAAGGPASPAPPPAAAPPPTLAAQSIAVMPFMDLTDSRDKGYFADGLAEELIALLGRSASHRVVPRTASFYYKGKDVEMTTIAERLRVNHILEGSVRVSDDRVRVLATLSDARSATLLWSESFEIAPAGIFDVQDTIATAVADALAIQLDVGPSETAFAAPTQNVGAYEFYLRGLDYLNRPKLSLIHISEPTRHDSGSRVPSWA